MYMNYYDYADTRIEDFWRDYQHSAERYGLPAPAGLGSHIRRFAGDALISMGSRIKPRPVQRNPIAGVWMGR